jgi:hypothetical protein
MVRIQHAFPNITLYPHLSQLVSHYEQVVKDMRCGKHPEEDTFITLYLVQGQPNGQIEACCDPFAETVMSTIAQSDPVS